MIKSLLSLSVITIGMASLPTLSKTPRGTSEIIAQAPNSSWKTINPDTILRIDLKTGPVYVALNENLAPNHVENIKALAKEQFYDGLTVYRYVEGFVAQGGEMEGSKPVKQGKKALQAEFSIHSKKPMDITPINAVDGYAERTGFLDGFAVAQNTKGTETWMVHCTGAFAMARTNDIHSGGTEFYITLAPQRVLDKNTTVFGQVIDGMEHIHKLDRVPTEGVVFNPIIQIRVLSDIRKIDKSEFKQLKTGSNEFIELIASRKARPGDWTVHRSGHIDVCSTNVPIKKVIAD